jgi:hypothetical protein
MYNYRAEFIEAYQATQELGYQAEKLVLSDRKSFSRDQLSELYNFCLQIIAEIVVYKGSNPYELLSANCLMFHSLMWDVIIRSSNYQAYFTLGYFYDANKGADLYKFSKSDLEKWLHEKNLNFSAIDMHAWVTLENLKIIDGTIETTIGMIRGDETQIGAVFYDYPENIAQDEGRIYHPVVVGTREMIDDINKAIINGTRSNPTGFHRSSNSDR